MNDNTFDYIVVGGGTAGCILASRLTEDPGVTVLLIEAGGRDNNIWVRVPLGLGKLLLNPACVWNSSTEPEPGLNGNRVPMLGGRMWGGSSSVNGMLVVRGHPARYDEWRDLGCPGWGASDVLPFFKKLETTLVGQEEFRGRSGPVPITEAKPDRLGAAFIEAAVSAGVGRAADYNGPDQEGTAPCQLNINRGARVNTSRAYLRSALRRGNLKVISNALAERILLREQRAEGVEYKWKGHTHSAYARAEIILCCGALRSPTLLELSGIGGSEQISSLGIPLVRHLPGVGENLADHFFGRLNYECKYPITLNDMLLKAHVRFREVFKYLIARRGMLSNPSFTALAFLKSDAGLPYPDIRVQLSTVSALTRLNNAPGEGLDPFSGFFIGGLPIYPKSRGSVHAASRDSSAAPRVVGNYLVDAYDAQISVKILRFLRKFAAQPALQRYIVREVRPGSKAETDDELLEHFRRTGDTSWHMNGTCRMGTGPDTVVSPDLRVHGIERLRVADASVFPLMVTSNTNIPTMMVAERAADLIKKSKYMFKN